MADINVGSKSAEQTILEEMVGWDVKKHYQMRISMLMVDSEDPPTQWFKVERWELIEHEWKCVGKVVRLFSWDIGQGYFVLAPDEKRITDTWIDGGGMVWEIMNDLVRPESMAEAMAAVDIAWIPLHDEVVLGRDVERMYGPDSEFGREG